MSALNDDASATSTSLPQTKTVDPSLSWRRRRIQTRTHLFPPGPELLLAPLSITNRILLACAATRGWAWRIVNPDIIELIPVDRQGAASPDEAPTNPKAYIKDNATTSDDGDDPEFMRPRLPIYCQRAVTEVSSFIGTILVDSKLTCHDLLRRHFRVAPTIPFTTTDAAMRFLQRHKRIVCKPVAGSHGKGVSVDITTPQQMEDAIQKAATAPGGAKEEGGVLLQRHVQGSDVRVLVVANRVVAAAARVPAHVIGDGTSTIRNLIDATNAHPWRGEGHVSPLTAIDIPTAAAYVAAAAKQKGLPVEQGDIEVVVPEAGTRVFLVGTANLSSGGISVDITLRLEKELVDMVERIVRVCGTTVAGVDLAVRGFDPMDEATIRWMDCTVIEVNKCPGLRMHHFPTVGKTRDAAGHILDAVLRQRARIHRGGDIKPPLPIASGSVTMLVLLDKTTDPGLQSLRRLLLKLVKVNDLSRVDQVWIAAPPTPGKVGDPFADNAAFFEDPAASEGLTVVRIALPCDATQKTELHQWTRERCADIEQRFQLILPAFTSPPKERFTQSLSECFPECRIVNGIRHLRHCASTPFLQDYAPDLVDVDERNALWSESSPFKAEVAKQVKKQLSALATEFQEKMGPEALTILERFMKRMKDDTAEGKDDGPEEVMAVPMAQYDCVLVCSGVALSGFDGNEALVQETARKLALLLLPFQVALFTFSVIIWQSPDDADVPTQTASVFRINAHGAILALAEASEDVQDRVTKQLWRVFVRSIAE